MEQTITWGEVGKYLDFIQGALGPVEYKAIYAVPRGGLVVAGMLAYKMGITKIFTTVGLDEQHAQVYKRFLIVDDIADTGKTLLKLRRRFPNAQYVTLFKKEGYSQTGLVYGRSVPKANRLIFPWDTPNSAFEEDGKTQI